MISEEVLLTWWHCEVKSLTYVCYITIHFDCDFYRCHFPSLSLWRQCSACMFLHACTVPLFTLISTGSHCHSRPHSHSNTILGEYGLMTTGVEAIDFCHTKWWDTSQTTAFDRIIVWCHGGQAVAWICKNGLVLGMSTTCTKVGSSQGLWSMENALSAMMWMLAQLSWKERIFAQGSYTLSMKKVIMPVDNAHA